MPVDFKPKATSTVQFTPKAQAPTVMPRQAPQITAEQQRYVDKNKEVFGGGIMPEIKGLASTGFTLARGVGLLGAKGVDKVFGTETEKSMRNAGPGNIFSDAFGRAIQPVTPRESRARLAGDIATILGPSGSVNSATAGLSFLPKIAARVLPDVAISAIQNAGTPGADVTRNTAVTGLTSTVANALLPGNTGSLLSTTLKSGASGYVADVATGLTGMRGEDRTGWNAAIPGYGTGIGIIAPPALAGAGRAYSRITTPSTQRYSDEIVEMFEKGVKPNLPGKTTPTTRTRFNNQVVEGVSVINQNKAGLQFTDEAGEIVTGRAPQTLKEFSDSIEQTKARIYSQYDELATRAGQNGLNVETVSIANSLDEVINNKALQLSHPEAVAYAKSVQDRLRKAGPLNAKTVQEVIQNYNNSLQAFYRNPTPEGITRHAVDAMIANRMRQALDAGIEGLTGAQYQQLKNQYAALKAIERDVMRATLRDARKNIKGLIDYTDIFSGGQVVNGILSANPATVASGLTQKAISQYFKYLNNPNRAIQQMFQIADRLPIQQSTIPISTRKQLPAPAPGTPNVQVDTPINLGARTQSTIDAQEMSRIQGQSNQLPANSLRATSPAASMSMNGTRRVIPTSKPQPAQQATDLSTGARQGGSLPKSILQRAKDALMPDLPNKEGGMIINPFSKQSIKAIDQATKAELADLNKYLKNGTYDRKMENLLETLGKKYGIPLDKSKKVQMNYISGLLERTKTTDALPGTTTRDPYARWRARVKPGQLLVKDNKGRIGLIKKEAFDGTIYTRI